MFTENGENPVFYYMLPKLKHHLRESFETHKRDSYVYMGVLSGFFNRSRNYSYFKNSSVSQNHPYHLGDWILRFFCHLGGCRLDSVG